MKIDKIVEREFESKKAKINTSDLQAFRRNIIKKVIQEYKSEFDLLVRTRKVNRPLIKFLNKIGEVKYKYKHIPYIALTTSEREGKELLKYFYEERDSTLIREYRNQINLLTSIDLASSITIEPPKRSKVVKSVLEEELWNLSLIGAYYAQRISLGDDVTIAIIDTGVDYEHKELKGNFGMKKGYDFIRDKNDPFDYNGHGTHVAGIIAGKNTGISHNSRLIALRILDEDGSGTEFDLIRALEYCYDNNIDLINMSLGSPYASEALEEICYKTSTKSILIAAAGNDGNYLPNYPAAFGEAVISVASINQYKQHSYFSNLHETVDICAPGENIYSSIPNDKYDVFSGTSMATPHVTGSLALALSLAKNSSFLEELMKSSAEKLNQEFEFPKEYAFGFGLVRVDKMVSKLNNENSRRIRKLFKKIYSRR
ncbi:MAG: hypothetical protein PWP03_652 [Candidatus Woesearchaeota archaeon]|nr:hypothetical protein [Candidatus Woesearchaeota archaeon]MDN5328014.1 hypothetical protein [Candidatus Woesearchaeota archaeon]